MSSRLPSRAGVSWGVSSFLSGRLLLLACCSYSSRGASRPSISFHPSRLVLLARLRSSHLRLPGRRPVLSRSAVPPSSRPCRLAGASCLPVSFFFSFVSSALRACDEVFMRGRRAIRIIPMGVRLVPCVLVRSVLARLPGSVRRHPLPGLRHQVMRRREDGKDGKVWGERQDELDKTARRQDGRQACGTSGKTG